MTVPTFSGHGWRVRSPSFVGGTPAAHCSGPEAKAAPLSLPLLQTGEFLMLVPEQRRVFVLRALRVCVYVCVRVILADDSGDKAHHDREDMQCS